MSADVCLDRVFSLPPLSFGKAGATLAFPADLPQSNAEPGVFGVLLADPKDAKAPVPKPKAPEGEAIPALFSGAL